VPVEVIRYQGAERVLTITLHRPEKLAAFTAQTVAVLPAASSEGRSGHFQEAP